MSVLSIITILLLCTTSPSFSTTTTTPDENPSSSMTSNNCCQGPMGVPGIPGSPGGYGPLGPAGPKGEIGQPGLSVKGNQGEVGTRGFSGPRGDTGLRGPMGKVGPVGNQGPRGGNGLDGAPGVTGPKGEKGESGLVQFAGFTVAKSSHQSSWGIVTFDLIITNAEEDFDTNSNKFTCRIPGYYQFTFAIFSIDSNYPVVTLQKNGEIVVGMHTRPSGTDNYRNMGSNSALVLLTSGDQVWLQNHHAQYIYGDSTYKRTSFSGVLLREILM